MLSFVINHAASNDLRNEKRRSPRVAEENSIETGQRGEDLLGTVCQLGRDESHVARRSGQLL